MLYLAMVLCKACLNGCGSVLVVILFANWSSKLHKKTYVCQQGKMWWVCHHKVPFKCYIMQSVGAGGSDF